MKFKEPYDIGVDNTDTIITSKADTHDLTRAKAEFDRHYFEPDVICPIVTLGDH